MKKFKLIIIMLMAFGFLMATSIFEKENCFSDIHNTCDVYGYGMGQTGISDLFRINTSLANPSLAATISEVYFSTGVFYHNTEYTLKDKTKSDDNYSFPYFNIIVPIKENHKFAINFFSSANGLYKYEDKSIDTTYSKRSESYKAEFIYAWKNEIVNFGLGLSYNLGSIEETIKKDTTYKFYNSIKYNYLNYNIGLNKKIGNLALGFTYMPEVKTKSESNETITKKNSTTDTSKGVEKTFKFPARYNLGATYQFSTEYKTSLEFSYEDWTESDLYAKVNDSYKIGFGFAYDPIWGYDSWYKSIPLRLGGYYRLLPYKYDAKNDVKEYCGTFGLTIPLKSRKSKLELSFSYLNRFSEDVNNQKVEDKTISIGLGISGFDLFQKIIRKTFKRDIPKAKYDY